MLNNIPWGGELIYKRISKLAEELRKIYRSPRSIAFTRLKTVIVSSADIWGIFNQGPSTRKGFQIVKKNTTQHLRDAPQYCHSPLRARRGDTTLKEQGQGWTHCSHRDFCLEGLISVFSVAGTAQSSSFVCHPVMKEGSVADTDNNKSEPKKNTTPRRLNHGWRHHYPALS